MKFPGAPHGLKMACGENPKRVYGEARRRRRRAWATSPATARPSPTPQDYQRQWQKYEANSPPTRRKRQARTAIDEDAERRCRRSATSGSRRWSPRCKGEILVHIHCYRADEMARCSTSRTSSASRSPRSTTASRPTRSPTGWRRKASAARCGPTGGASRWRPTTASGRTSRSSTHRRTAARSSTRTPTKASSG